MSKYLIQDTTLTGIADAIREKDGTTAGIIPENMANKIRSIQAGINTTDATATASDILSGKTAYANGTKVTGNIETVSQATPSITISASGKITASSSQSTGYVAGGTKTATKQMTVQAAKTYTPSTSNQTIDAQTFLTGMQTILGDPNLLSENIALGVSIFGIEGTYDNSCLIEGTSINMADGTEKAVEDLKTGDIVQSYDPATNTLVPAVVIKAYITGASRKYTAYNFSDGRYLTVYGMHGFYNEKSGMTKDIREINRNDRLINISGESIQWAGSRDVYFAGAKKLRYNVVTSNNLYFANGLLLGSRPYNKLQIALDRHLEISDSIKAVWQQDCDDYNNYTSYLNNPDFYMEIKDSYQELAKAKNIINVNKKRLANTDYKAQKFVEGLLNEEEWTTAKNNRALYRKEINDNESVITERRTQIDEIIAKYRGTENTPRSIFEACCTRDNAIFEEVKAYFVKQN